MTDDSNLSTRHLLWLGIGGFWAFRFLNGRDGFGTVTGGDIVLLVGGLALLYVALRGLDAAISWRFSPDDPGVPDEIPCRTCGTSIRPGAARCGRCNTRDPARGQVAEADG